jgi:hypothetical protein
MAAPPAYVPLISVATGAKLIELGDLANRIAAIEAALGPHRRSDEASVFPTEELR